MVQENEVSMTTNVTYSQARASLARLLDDVTQNRDIVIIRRRKGEDAALIAASELTSLVETAYLLRSPANADRLLTALNDTLKGGGIPMSLDELRAEVGLDGETA
jgi:antitoxin YefM